MHQIKCAGILGWKKVSQLISRHGPARPRFRIIFVLFYWSFQCNFVSFFTIRNAAGCPTKYFLWILNKRPAAGALFQCLDRCQQEVIPPIWSPLKNRHYTHLNQNIVSFFLFYMFFWFFHFFTIFLIFYLFIFFYYFFIFLFFFIFFSFFLFLFNFNMFSVFPRKFLPNLMNFRGNKEKTKFEKNNKIKKHFSI